MSIRTLLVARLKEQVPLLNGQVFGTVDFEAALMGNLKVNSAFVYRDNVRSEPLSDTNTARQEQITKYSIVVITKNVKDNGEQDSADVNDEICAQIRAAIMGWVVDGSPFEHVSGKAQLMRNMLLWEEIYSHRTTYRQPYIYS